MTELVIIAAIARNGMIGATVDGKPVMPWRLPEDLKRFKTLTLGHPIIMGRKTWESLGRPLPGRQNIVITRTAGYVAEGAIIVGSLQEAIKHCSGRCAFVIGGGEIYAQALTLADRLELTEIDADFAGDTHFPANAHAGFAEVAREGHHAEAGFDYAFVTYRRTPAANSAD
jgi:dihydrofolate reductase